MGGGQRTACRTTLGIMQRWEPAHSSVAHGEMPCGRSCATRRGEGRFASLRGEAGELVALVVIAPHVLVVVVLILVFISGVVVIVVFICGVGRERGRQCV